MRLLRGMVGVGAAMAALGPGVARGEWGPPLQVAAEPASAHFSNLQVGFTPDRGVLVTWGSTAHVISGARVFPSGSVGPAFRISPPGDRAYGALLGVTRDGGAVVAWSEGPPRLRRVRAAVIRPDRSVGTPQTISHGPGANRLTSLAVAPDGSAVAVWERRPAGKRVYVGASCRPRGGRFGDPVALGADGSQDPHAAIDAQGHAVVAWLRTRTPKDSRVQVASGRRCRFASPHTLSTTGVAQQSRVAVDAAGAAAVGWTSADGDSWALDVARRPGRGKPWLLTREVATGGPLAVTDLDIAAAAGRAFAAWSFFPPHGSEVRNPATRFTGSAPGGGPFSMPVTLSRAGSAAFQPEVRAGADLVVAAWLDIPQAGDRRGTIAAASGAPGARLGAPVVLSDPGLTIQSLTQARVAVDNHGDAAVAWVDYGLGGSGQGEVALALFSGA